MDSITLSTCQAPNMNYLCRDLAEYLAPRLRIPVRLRIDPLWTERDRLLDEGEIDLCWICGLPYVRKVERSPGIVTPLAAPVMAGSRYEGHPIYYSDVVVHRDSPFRKFGDLRGAVWAFNEPGSQSGYGIVRYTLASRGETFAFFGRVVESGAHQASLGMILQREVDASAIDSTVLEQELRDHPWLTSELRVVEVMGPSPMPPWVAGQRVTPEMRQALQNALTGMHARADGRAILARAGVARFQAVDDSDYDPIREMACTGWGESFSKLA
jgi:phosphonate transport system substrate-binding protein